MLSHWWAATSNNKGSDRMLLQDLQTGPSKQNWQDQEIENAEKSRNIFKKNSLAGFVSPRCMIWLYTEAGSGKENWQTRV